MKATAVKCFTLFAAWLWALHPANASSVELQAVLGKTAVMLIDGQRESLTVGETTRGVTLINAETTSVTIEVGGQRKTLGLSQMVSTNFEEAPERVVTIVRNSRMQYQTNATINGRQTLVLVDTGANVVAISSVQARAMNIDFEDKPTMQVETASGFNAAYPVTLNSINVGGISVPNVQAMVVEGGHPATVLLGMSYLKHVKMQEQNGILSLSRGH